MTFRRFYTPTRARSLSPKGERDGKYLKSIYPSSPPPFPLGGEGRLEKRDAARKKTATPGVSASRNILSQKLSPPHAESTSSQPVSRYVAPGVVTARGAGTPPLLGDPEAVSGDPGFKSISSSYGSTQKG